MELSKDKRTFLAVSILYAIMLTLFSLTTYLYCDLIEGKTILMISISGLFTMTILYFQALQLKVRRRVYPPIVSLTGICLMIGLAIGIFTMLIMEVKIFKPSMWTIFSIVYAIGTIWTGRRLWTENKTS